jgi:hypothetical protein
VSPSTAHRIIVTLYAVLSLAALGRSSFQILTKFDEAPLAYTLSAVAAIVYVIATLSVAQSQKPLARRIARWSLTIELVGVLGVGLLSFVVPELFPDQTVWSQFGVGYLLIPLFLPVLGLWWLGKRVSS